MEATIHRPLTLRGPQRLKRRTRRMITLWTLGILLVAGILLAAPQVVETLPRSEAPIPAVHVVAAGETLWEIASLYSGNSDPRPLIQKIRQVNQLSNAVIRPGMSLTIPAGGRR